MILTETTSMNEEKILECKRNATIREQARVILRIIYQYKHNASFLKKKLVEYKTFITSRLQPDAVELVLDFVERKKDLFLTDLKDEVRDILIAARINSSNPQDQRSCMTNSLNQEQAMFEMDCTDPGMEVCELIGSYIGNLLSKKNSPKCRVFKNHKEQVKVAVASSHDFCLAKDNKDLQKNAQGFAEFVATSILVGDCDFMDNAAIKADQNKHYFWARNNNTTALFYTKLENITDKINKKQINIDFVCELNKAVDYLDEKRIRLTIKTALENLKETYKINYLHNKQIAEVIKERLNIEEELSEQILEDKIIEYMKEYRVYLKKFAENKFLELMKEENHIKDDSTINYKQYFNSLIKKDKVPTDLALFMKHAIRTEDFKGVEYINELNTQLNFDNIRINNSTPLEFALKEEKNELALKMLKAGYIMNYNEVNKSERDKKNIEMALENIIARKMKRA